MSTSFSDPLVSDGKTMELACPVTAVAGVNLKRMMTIFLLVFTET